MTSESQPPQNDGINPNLFAFALIVTLIIVVAFIASDSSSASQPPSAAGLVAEAATATSTHAEPTATPIPPTATPAPPTATAQPATATALPPTATALPPSATPSPAATEVAAASTPVPQTGAAVAAYDEALVARGQTQFVLCAACHGADGRGVANLGKDLISSDFVHGLTDQELLAFIKTGRPIWDPLNTTGIDMPPKGGNPAMTDDDILAVIAYIRTLTAEDSGAAAPAPADSAAAPVAAVAAAAYDPVLVAEGQTQFALCAACHGADGRGVANLGKDLVSSEFVAGLTDQDLLTFIKTGRPIWDPLNTTGIDMPPKGGNPAMTDEQILAVIAYIRTLEAGN